MNMLVIKRYVDASQIGEATDAMMMEALSEVFNNFSKVKFIDAKSKMLVADVLIMSGEAIASSVLNKQIKFNPTEDF